MRSPILVLGSPRSGTSLTAGLLHQLGAWVGECKPADKWNPKGYFENDAIRALCWARGKARVVSVADVRDVLASQGWQGGPWLYKHAPHRVDHWANFTPIRVKVWRDPESILRSRLTMGRSADKVRQDIERHHALMRDMSGIDFHPERLINGDDIQLRRVAEFCGLKFDPEALGLVRKNLWHH